MLRQRPWCRAQGKSSTQKNVSAAGVNEVECSQFFKSSPNIRICTFPEAHHIWITLTSAAVPSRRSHPIRRVGAETLPLKF